MLAPEARCTALAGRMCAAPRHLVWLWLVLWLWGSAASAGDWNVRRKDRWGKIASRLLSLYVGNPTEGYALRRLVQHYRRHGGAAALRKRLFQLRIKRPKDRKIRLAETLLSLHIGQYKKAIQGLQALLEQPKLSVATERRLKWHLARAYFREQLWGKARTLYLSQLRFAKSKSRKRKILKALIQLDSQRGAWKEARVWYQKLLVMRPRDLALRLGLARALARQKLWKEAITTLEKAMPLAPQRRRPALWNRLVRYHMQVQQYAQALIAIDKARRLLMRTHWLHNALNALEIDAHRAQKTLPALVVKYRKRALRNPKQYLPLQARLHVELGQNKAALAAYKKLLKRHPKHPAFTSAVTLLLEQKKIPEAVVWLRQRLKIMPADEATAMQLLGILHHEGKAKPRDQLFAKILAKHGKNSFFLHKLSRKMRRWQAAFPMQANLYKRLCSLKPPRARCFDEWGTLLWKHRKKKQAKKVWGLIRTMEPRQPDDLFLLAEIYRRHKWDTLVVPLLQEVLQQAPQHIKARRMLAQVYLRQKKYRVALPHLRAVLAQTKSLRLRQQTRIEILQAHKKMLDLKTLGLRFQRDVILAPFAAAPRKMFLAYHIHLRRRKYRVRTRRRVFYHRRRMRHRYYRRRFARRRVTYRYVYRRAPLTAQAQKLLVESLALFPEDPEFRLLALKIDSKGPKAWEHLRRLVLLDLSQTESYVRQLKSLAGRYKKDKALLELLKTLTVRWPYQAAFWGHLGEAALGKGDVKLGCQAYARAAKLAAKQFSYRLGQARCLAAQQRWRAAHRELLRLPHPHETPLRRKWLHHMTQFGLESGIPLTDLFLSYQRTLSKPAESLMEVIEQLQMRPNQSSVQQKQLKQLIVAGWPMWKRVVLSSTKYHMRAKALFLLYDAPKKESLPVFQKALKDAHASVRSAAIIALGLLGQRQLYFIVDRMGRYERSHNAKAAARLAGALMAGQFSLRLYNHVSRWVHLHPWVVRALHHQHKQINYRSMSLLARIYPRGKRPTRWQLMKLLDKLTGDAAIWLGKMRANNAYRCFAFDGLTHMQRRGAPAHLRAAAKLWRVYPNAFKRYCPRRFYAR